MNNKILQTLEYDKIIHRLATLTVTPAGKNYAEKLRPSSDFQEVQQWLNESLALVDIIRLHGRLPLTKFGDISEVVKRLKIKASLNASELANIGLVLRVGQDILSFMDDENNADSFAFIQNYLDLIQIPTDFLKQLRRSVEYDGTVLDTASKALAQIRGQITSYEDNIKERMSAYISGNNAKYLSETLVTIRDDRYVIPVRAEYRGKFGGVVHDQSASGQTLFVEPQAVVDMNNRLQQLFVNEKTEISNVLKALSAEAREHLLEITNTFKALGVFDFLQAKAFLAKEMKATLPLVNKQQQVHLQAARHPLIDPKKVVPNDIYLGFKFDTMLITGPNTGGKTITLKTLGLLQLMAQSGLFISAGEESQVGVFKEIFADIGDEQSIEQSLSTFSSHMDNIINILHHVDNQSLVLLDELGAGTDPEEGAALAIAILDQLQQKKVKTAVTTHYPELKLYGYDRKRTTNASMEFDTKTLSPTYRLQIGIPGHSNAFEIVQHLGMSKDIVDRARHLITNEDSNLNKMISNLNFQTKAANKARHSFEQHLKETQGLQQELEQALDIYRKRVDKQNEHARKQADQIIQKAQSQAAEIIAQLRQEGKAGIKEDKLIAATGALNKLRNDNLAHNKVLQRAKAKQQIKVNDEVKVLSYDQYGTVTKLIDKHTFEVQIGILKVRVKEADLEKQAKPEAKKAPKQRTVAQTRKINTATTHSTLDLRGQRYDEAMTNLDRYMDEVLLAGLDEVTIIHGIGTGAIRNGVSQYLKRNRHVKSFGYAPEGAGGSGATIVELR